MDSKVANSVPMTQVIPRDTRVTSTRSTILGTLFLVWLTNHAAVNKGRILVATVHQTIPTLSIPNKEDMTTSSNIGRTLTTRKDNLDTKILMHHRMIRMLHTTLMLPRVSAVLELPWREVRQGTGQVTRPGMAS